MQKVQEIQGLADYNNTKGFYDAIKALYGHRKRAVTPVHSADGATLFKDRNEILGHWANHFEILLNHTKPVDLDILDELPDLPPVAHLDSPPEHFETHQATQGLKNNKSDGPDGIQAEVFKQGWYLLTRHLHLLTLHLWEHQTLPQDCREGSGKNHA